MKPFSIQYTPELTEDIFNKLKEWCYRNNSGHREWYDWRKENNYSQFKDYRWFWWDDGSKRVSNYLAGVDNNPQGKTEITLQKLLEILQINSVSYELY